MEPNTKNNEISAALEDELDALPEKLSFEWYDMWSYLFAIAFYIGDMGLDALVAYNHYTDGNTTYFALTVAFVVIPMLTMMFFSLKWYIADRTVHGLPKATPFVWFIRIVLLFLQLGLVLRYMDALNYGVKYRKTKKKAYYQWMTFEDADAGILRLFEAFMEAAPQLLLQIYILAQPDNDSDFYTVVAQVVSSAFSLISLSMALASQQRSTRISLINKPNPTWAATFVQVLWYLFVTGSRMLVMGLFASVFPLPFVIVCIVRWLIMNIWLQFMDSHFCDRKIEEFLYKCVLGVVFLFCYFNPVDSPTRWRYFFFYLYTFTENSILISIWFSSVDPELWYRLPAMVAIFSSFFVGIAFMVLYYVVCHPTIGIQLCCWWPQHNKLENFLSPVIEFQVPASNGYHPVPTMSRQVESELRKESEKDENISCVNQNNSACTLPGQNSPKVNSELVMRKHLPPVTETAL